MNAAERLPNALAAACTSAAVISIDGTVYRGEPEHAPESCQGCAFNERGSIRCEQVEAAAGARCFDTRLIWKEWNA